MTRQLKIIAISTPPDQHSGFTFIAEIDAETVRALTRTYVSSVKVGESIEIGNTLDRLSALEERERQMKTFAEILQKFTLPPKAE